MKLLCWDVETLPLLCFTWGLKPDYIPHENIVQETSVVCASWMFLGERKTPDSVSILDNQRRFKSSIYDDYHCIKKLHEVLGEADVLLGQNADKFDFPMFQARAKIHGFPPLASVESIDTLKEARKAFRLPSYKLDSMARFFLGERKRETGGMRLWLDIVQRDYPPMGEDSDEKKAIKAIDKMVKYNKQDVKLTAQLYEEIRPYFKKHPNRRLYDNRECCPRCGSDDVVRKGVRVRLNGKFQEWKCKDCLGHYSSTLSQERDHVKLV